jgi:hypothetical protein
MNKLLIFLFICLFPNLCFGEDIFIAQSTQGADSGADCSNAHSAAWFNTSGNWANPKVSGKIGPGDTAHLCGTITSPLTTQNSGSVGSVITILFESGATFSAPTWTVNTGALTVNNNCITIDGGINGTVEATDNGTTATFGGTKTYNRNIYGVYVKGGSNVTIQNLIIRTIYDRLASSTDCLAVGRGIQIEGNSSNILLNNNTISDAVLAISDVLSNTSNITVSNNTISNAGVGINMAPGNTSSTGSNVNVYGNTVTGGPKWDGTFDSNCQIDGCSSSCLTDNHYHQDGMHLFSQGDTGWVDSVNVYNNYLQDFGTHSTAHIYIEYHGMKNVKIYNNVLVNTGTNYAANGMITIKAADGVKIYNNTLVGAGTSNNIGIYWNSSGGVTSQGGDIQNNIIASVRTIMGWAVGTTWTADHNDFYNYSDAYAFQDSSNAFHTYTWWTGQGYDAHGTIENPQLGSNYKPTSSSPNGITSGGINLSSVFTFDKDFITRPSAGGWSMGAYVGSLNAPSNLQTK